jgi:hypothetical protein
MIDTTIFQLVVGFFVTLITGLLGYVAKMLTSTLTDLRKIIHDHEHRISILEGWKERAEEDRREA